ncbi:glycoside hydrolase family 78 protein [Actinomadura madurae]|uniref:glycoside hydrolase family 78 protein n=1 Tax=Actinomadura madurae TaxID=1993 RepID=UPI003FD8DCBD
MIHRVTTVVLALSALGAAPAQAVGATRAAGDVQVGGLTVEHQVDPLGVDDAKPRLGWTLSAHARGAGQSAYEVEVSTTRDGPADVWDSGKVRSSRSFDIEYAGPALRSRTRYFWRVRVWDAAHRASRWSRAGAVRDGVPHSGRVPGDMDRFAVETGRHTAHGCRLDLVSRGRAGRLGAGRDPLLPACVRPSRRRPGHFGPVQAERRRQVHPVRERQGDSPLAGRGRLLEHGDRRRHLGRPALRPQRDRDRGGQRRRRPGRADRQAARSGLDR